MANNIVNIKKVATVDDPMPNSKKTSSFTSKYSLKLMLYASVLIIIFLRLGVWQIDRYKQKDAILKNLHQKMSQEHLTKENLPEKYSSLERFTKIALKNEDYEVINKKFLLDNKVLNKVTGFNLIVPVKLLSSGKVLLIDRGFVPRGKNAQSYTDKEKPLSGDIKGSINHISSGMTLVKDTYSKQTSSPIILQELDYKLIAKYIAKDIFPYVVTVEDEKLLHSHIANIKPKKHLGYAFQWFSFAALVIIYISIGKYLKFGKHGKQKI